MRDGLIQRFEFTYELCHVMLRRHLEAASQGGDNVDHMSFPTLIRSASEQGLLLHGWDVWEAYRRARNLTSHTYNEAAALAVVAQLPGFALDAQYLLARLHERIV